MENDNNTNGSEAPADPERRSVAALILGALGASALQGCLQQDGAIFPEVHRALSALSGPSADFAWVDAVLGAAPPAARTGELANRTASELSAKVVVAKGCVRPGDGGGGVFYWALDSSVTDDGGTIIVPHGTVGSPGANGCWKRIYSGPFNVRWFGAVADGTDAAQAFTLAIQAALAGREGGAVFVPAGKYQIWSNVLASVPGPSPKGLEIVGVPGASVLMPTSAVTVALTLQTGLNSDGTTNWLRVAGIRLDGVDTGATGATGVLVAATVPGTDGIVSANITLEDVEILRFAGSGGRGLHVQDAVKCDFARVYVGGCETNLYVAGTHPAKDTPAFITFHSCSFRLATARGVDIVNVTRASFRHCIVEANGQEGVYCVPPAGHNAGMIEFDDCWFEQNWMSDPNPSTNYQIKAIGKAYSPTELGANCMLRIANTNFFIPEFAPWPHPPTMTYNTGAVYLKTVINTIVDNIWPVSTPPEKPDQVYIDEGCRGFFANWPGNSVTFGIVVKNLSQETFNTLQDWFQRIYSDPATGNPVPAATAIHDIGMTAKRFRNLWLSGQMTSNAIYLPHVIAGTNASGGPPGQLSFFDAPLVSKPNVTGSQGGNAALASLLTALASLGLITNSTA